MKEKPKHQYRSLESPTQKKSETPIGREVPEEHGLHTAQDHVGQDPSLTRGHVYRPQIPPEGPINAKLEQVLQVSQRPWQHPCRANPTQKTNRRPHPGRQAKDFVMMMVANLGPALRRQASHNNRRLDRGKEVCHEWR